MTLRSRHEVVEFEVDLRHWRGPELTIAVLSDLHVVAPWTSLRDVERFVEDTNAMAPDIVVLAGDYLTGKSMPGRVANASEIAAVLDALRARHGVIAILGNHDWFDCELAESSDFQRSSVVEAFERSSISLLRNGSAKLSPGGHDLWLVGFDSQRPVRIDWNRGLHRPEEAYAGVPEGVATILLAHEPEYFGRGDGRAGLQISGHTHGGQLNLFGWRPLVRLHSDMGYAYGHYRDGDRSLIVSGGLGFSGGPRRIGQAPEITVVRVRGGRNAT